MDMSSLSKQLDIRVYSNTNQTETGAVETLPPARTVGTTGAASVVGHSFIKGAQ